MRPSPLATRAVECRPPDDDARPDGRAAGRTGPTGTVVNSVVELEPALAAEAVPVVRDRRAAAADGLHEDRAACGHDPPAVVAREARRAAAGADAGPEEDLVRVDVAEARNPALVHDQGLDRGATRPGQREERIGRERVAERIDAFAGLGHQSRRLDHGHPAEAAGIVVGEDTAIVELDYDMIVAAVGPVARGEGQLTGHAEVHEPEAPVVEGCEQVLAPAHHLRDATAREPRRKGRRHAPAEASLPHAHGDDTTADDGGREGPEHRLDLGQLGHGYGVSARASRANASRSSVSARALGATSARANALSRSTPRPRARAARALRSIFRRCPKEARTTSRKASSSPRSIRGAALQRTSTTADSTRGGGRKLRRDTRNASRTSAKAW